MVKKIFIALILVFVLVFGIASVLSVNASAANSQYIYDEAGFLNEAEIEKLNLTAADAYGKHGIIIIVATVRGFEGIAEQTGVKFMNEHGLDMTKDSTLLMISDENGTYRMRFYEFPVNKTVISPKEGSRIDNSEDVIGNIRAGNFYSGIDAFINKSAKAYSGILWGDLGITLIVGGVVFVIFALIFIFSIIASYKKKMRSTNYPLDRYTKLNMTHSQDVFLGSHVSRVRINNGNGQGGGGGGMRSGGGHRSSR